MNRCMFILYDKQKIKHSCKRIQTIIYTPFGRSAQLLFPGHALHTSTFHCPCFSMIPPTGVFTAPFISQSCQRLEQGTDGWCKKTPAGKKASDASPIAIQNQRKLTVSSCCGGLTSEKVQENERWVSTHCFSDLTMH